MLRIATGIAAATFAFGATAAPETFTIDSLHTYPYFTVNHLGLTNLMGRFDKTSGKVTVDNAAKTGSIDLVIEAASISTGDSERGSRPRTRDEHLRSPDFFNAAEFPRITYKGATAKWSGDSPGALDGQITLLGVTKPLTLTIESWKCIPDPLAQGKRQRCGGNASGTMKRSDFGMKAFIPGISDELRLYVAIEAIGN
jgi:polyisoprenoid-binding protein YceI